MPSAIETRLAPGGWLSHDDFGLADAAVLPYVLRLDQLALTPLIAADTRPVVADWFDRVRARPSFDSAVTQWVPAPIIAMFRKNGEALWPSIEPLLRD